MLQSSPAVGWMLPHTRWTFAGWDPPDPVVQRRSTPSPSWWRRLRITGALWWRFLAQETAPGPACPCPSCRQRWPE